jgi:hypothetical protein
MERDEAQRIIFGDEVTSRLSRKERIGAVSRRRVLGLFFFASATKLLMTLSD